MTQKDKELLLKDLCARLPYGVLVKIIDKKPINPNNICKLVGIDLNIGSYSLVDIYNYTIETGIEGFKPFLRSMSSMTKDELEEYNHLAPGVVILDGVHIPNIHQVDWLNANHFDYRGLIEKGLALEAPDGMYDLKDR